MRIKLGGRNYKRGSSFEWRWLDGLFKNKKAIRGARFFRSTGPRWKPDYGRMNDAGTDWAWKHCPVDIWWIDKKGKYHEDQCKFGSNRVGVIDTDEMLDIIMYAWENPCIQVSLVSKEKNKKFTHVWIINNKEI